MDFSPITTLKLKEAFKGTLFDEVENDTDYIKCLFEHGNSAQLFACDSNEKGYSTFISDTSGVGKDKCFIVRNNKHIDVFLWRIDGVLYGKDTKCDCAILTSTQLDFVEFKTNAANSSSEAIRQNYEKACDQLSSTIKDVKRKCGGVNILIEKERSLKAFAVFNRTVPRITAYENNLKRKFLKENKIRLSFENEVNIE